MPNEVTINLQQPVTAASGNVIKQITLRSPTLRDVEELGAMIKVRRTSDGAIVVPRILYPVLEKYIRRCLVAPADADWLDDLGVADTGQLVDAMVEFAKSIQVATASLPIPGNPPQGA